MVTWETYVGNRNIYIYIMSQSYKLQYIMLQYDRPHGLTSIKDNTVKTQSTHSFSMPIIHLLY